jgi:hypothetical protein
MGLYLKLHEMSKNGYNDLSIKQGFGSGSVSGSGSRRAKMTHKIEKSPEFSCF